MTLTRGYELVHPDYYAENGPPYEHWDRLRSESPVHACELDDVEPFWAITRQEEIKYISKTPELFLSEPGITLLPTDREIDFDSGIGAMKGSSPNGPKQSVKRSRTSSSIAWFGNTRT